MKAYLSTRHFYIASFILIAGLVFFYFGQLIAFRVLFTAALIYFGVLYFGLMTKRGPLGSVGKDYLSRLSKQNEKTKQASE